MFVLLSTETGVAQARGPNRMMGLYSDPFCFIDDSPARCLFTVG